MMKKYTFILLLCVTFSLILCDKETTPEAGENPVFYVAGSVGTQEVRYATIWKNGVATTVLSHATNNCYANSVYVKGSDVYVVAEEQHQEDLKTIAKLWKNGVITNLTDGENDNSTVSAVFVK